MWYNRYIKSVISSKGILLITRGAFFAKNNMKNIGLTINFWDYINIVKDYSKEVQEIYYLLKIKDTNVCYNPLFKDKLKIGKEWFDLSENDIDLIKKLV